MTTPINNSVLKAFAILDVFCEQREEVTTGEIARLTGLNAITTHRFVKTLQVAGVLNSPRRGVYRLGGKLVDYGERAKSFRRLASQIQPFLNKLATKTGESAMATTFDGSQITCIAAAHSDHAISFNGRVGARMEAYATANGKLWLALAGQSALQSYLAAHDLVAFTTATLSDRGNFLSELEKIRLTGFATNHGEREKGLTAIAVPVLTRQGHMVAGISVFGPSPRFDDAKEEEILVLLRATTDLIENIL